MTDGINRIPPGFPQRSTERVEGPKSAGKMEQNKQEQINRDDPERVDAHGHRNVQQEALEELSLSIAAIRALIGHELPTEVQIALAGFADLGDLSDAGLLCDRIERKGLASITWRSTQTLRQALEEAAS